MAGTRETLILSGAQIAALATPPDYLAAVEAAFRALAAGEMAAQPVAHLPGIDGAFHCKAAIAAGAAPRAVLKLNGNFPANPARHGLPTIQGFVALLDRRDGRLLALMDSVELTARRTAAASALAVRHLARRAACRLAFVGCGVQAQTHLEALLALEGFAFTQLRCFDPVQARGETLCAQAAAAGLAATRASSVADACRGADVVVTCTPSTRPLVEADMIGPGACVLAVGADNPAKCEIAPALLARARVVADIAAQAVAMGDLRAALAAGAMRESDLHAELASLVTGARPGRRSEQEIFVFDSTGTAIEDLAAANLLYERAAAASVGLRLALHPP